MGRDRKRSRHNNEVSVAHHPIIGMGITMKRGKKRGPLRAKMPGIGVALVIGGVTSRSTRRPPGSSRTGPGRFGRAPASKNTKPAPRATGKPTTAKALERWENEGGRTLKAAANQGPRSIWTVGHSTRTIEEFLDILRGYQIRILVDVRHFPGSRRFPQFGKTALHRSLTEAGIRYIHMVELGGRRPARPDSRNLVWRNASFRGYADYMETQPFRAGIDRLLNISRADRTAIMCSEAVWWRCHRSMIADDLKAMGVQVLHILSPTKFQEHPYTSAAQLVDGRLSYAGPSPAAPHVPPGDTSMTHAFKLGDHVEWNSEAGRVRGTIKKTVRSAIKFKGYTARASKKEPQYLIKSDTTEHLAMHKGSALKNAKKT